ncbi:MipA/OmpV family protein [Pseudomonas sp. R2.Fl]|nr:MipA/OmpV family protein [Pseudomonas sp. R2.Fl]
MKKLLLPVLLLSLPFTAAAQENGEGDEEQGGPPRWGLGLATVVNDSPYAGEGTRVVPIPLVSYNGERFYFRGISLGWKVINTDSFELSALGKFRMDGFEVDDLGRQELAANGVDYRLLEDRDKSFDLGLGMKWTGRAGELEVELLADATDTSGGQEASIEYGYPIELGKGSLTPKVGITWQSKDMANYYYGTLDEEVARGVVDYKPGAVTVPSIGVGYFRPIGEKWSLMAFARYDILPDEIKNSPFIEPDTDGAASVFVGFSRGF